MPTYEYECKGCGKKFELFQKMTADTVADCPKCGAKAKRKIGSGAGIIFKGSGFYATDYKKRPADPEKKKPSGCPLKKDCKECNGSD